MQHIYLAIIAKAIAWAAMATPPDPPSLLHGEGFAKLGITCQAEPDFFDWVAATNADGDLVMRIWRHVSRFRLQDIRVDILKALYESLIDPETRHDLGEYYTPDWLAARIVAAAVTDIRSSSGRWTRPAAPGRSSSTLCGRFSTPPKERDCHPPKRFAARRKR